MLFPAHCVTVLGKILSAVSKGSLSSMACGHRIIWVWTVQGLRRTSVFFSNRGHCMVGKSDLNGTSVFGDGFGSNEGRTNDRISKVIRVTL